MSASEKLRAILQGEKDVYIGPALTDACWEILAVIEAAEPLYGDFAKYNPPDLLPHPIRDLGNALAALEEKLK